MSDDLATNSAPAPASEPAPAQEVAPTHELDTETSTDEAQPEGQAPAEEFEDIEREGKKARIPKWLKPELLMQADYTRKTQEVAEQRKQAEAAAAAVQAERQAWQQYQQDAGEYYALNAQIKDYAKLQQADWDRAYQENPAAAANAWQRYQMLQQQQNQIGTRLAQKDLETRTAAERDFATRFEQANTQMAKMVPSWNVDAPKVGQYLIDQGFKQDQVRFVAGNLAATQLAHKAYLYDQIQAKHRTAAAPTPAPVATPAPMGGSRAPTSDLRSLAARSDPSAYIKARNDAMKRSAR